MGDRTYVILTVPAVHAGEVAGIYNEVSIIPHGTAMVSEQGLDLVFFEFEDVNYGELDDLDKLEKLGIAFDSDWSQGDEYDEGCTYMRFDSEGNPVRKEIYQGDDAISMNRLLPLFDDHHKLRELIKSVNDSLHVIPWDDQVENGKIARLKHIVLGGKTHAA